MLGPHRCNQNGQQNGTKHCKPGVIGESNRQETKHERLIFIPVPEILVQDIDGENEQEDYEIFHGVAGAISKIAANFHASHSGTRSVSLLFYRVQMSLGADI